LSKPDRPGTVGKSCCILDGEANELADFGAVALQSLLY